MTRVNWPRVAVLTVIITFVLSIGLSWLWHWAGYGYYGMMGGWGFVSLSWPTLIAMWLMHLSFWVLVIVGVAWLVQATGNHSN